VDPAPLPDPVTGKIPEILPSRYAIAWFGHPNRDALVEPLEECCSAENPKKYGPVYAGRHVVERLAFLHKKGSNTATWTDGMQRQDERGVQSRKKPVTVGAAA
jgi:hypothetical protein